MAPLGQTRMLFMDLDNSSGLEHYAYVPMWKMVCFAAA